MVMKRKGFTLLEILVVIIIIGILAALALPQYMKTIKKARIAEAASNIGAIRGAQLRHYQERDRLVTGDSLRALDIEDPNAAPNRFFTYSVSGTTPFDMTITARGVPERITEGLVVTYDASTGKMTDNLSPP